jgi:hypothetical protein
MFISTLYYIRSSKFLEWSTSSESDNHYIKKFSDSYENLILNFFYKREPIDYGLTN